MSKDLSTTNNYGFQVIPAQERSAETDQSMIQVQESRAAQEVQAQYVIAKRFPRDENKAFSKVMKACERPFLADQAIYAYPKGGKVVEGASIRMAEVLLQCWGNCDAGIKEISQSNGVSVAEAYAVDLETNTRISKIFHVPHQLGTKQGVKKLTDSRDIYELVANQGARRMRACILAVIPGDIVDAALEKCKHTLSNGKEPIADRIRKMVSALDEYGVKIEHIEKRLGHKLDATIEAELITLRGIYKSIKDGMAKREDFFDMGNGTVVNSNVNELLAAKSAPKVDKDSAKVDKKSQKVDKETGEIMPNVPSYEKLELALKSAKSVDELDQNADFIRDLPENQQGELKDLYKLRRAQMS